MHMFVKKGGFPIAWQAAFARENKKGHFSQGGIIPARRALSIPRFINFRFFPMFLPYAMICGLLSYMFQLRQNKQHQTPSPLLRSVPWILSVISASIFLFRSLHLSILLALALLSSKAYTVFS